MFFFSTKTKRKKPRDKETSRIEWSISTGFIVTAFTMPLERHKSPFAALAAPAILLLMIELLIISDVSVSTTIPSDGTLSNHTQHIQRKHFNSKFFFFFFFWCICFIFHHFFCPFSKWNLIWFNVMIQEQKHWMNSFMQIWFSALFVHLVLILNCLFLEISTWTESEFHSIQFNLIYW